MKESTGYIIIILVFILSLIAGYQVGYKTGVNKGIITALDSINSIATQQLNNETISSKFYIQSTDTLEFILSPKTIKMKNYGK